MTREPIRGPSSVFMSTFMLQGRSLIGCAPSANQRSGGRRSTLRPRQERAQTDQIIGRRGKGDDPVHEFSTAVTQFAQATHGLHPAKHLLDELAFPLADGVPRMSRGSTINRTVLFLLDEMLNGTNSQDRRTGAQGILKALLERGALGLVTTHDLALTSIADALAPRAANVHFQDDLRDGRLHFDYKLRPGIIEKSNAIELMRSIGLDV